MSFLGNSVDWLGTALNLPEFGASEFLSGGSRTANTGRVPYNLSAAPITASSYQSAISTPGRVAVTGQPQVGTTSAPRPDGNTSNTYVQGQSTPTPGFAGGGGVGRAAGPSYDPNVVAQFDSGISGLNNALGRLPSQLDIARQNVGDQYNVALNRLNSAKNAAQNQYGQASTGNMQSLRSNKNNILDQQSQGLRGLLRTLGMYGAVGSDADLASEAVQNEATRQRSGAGSVFSQNQRSLDTNWGNFQEEDKNRRKEAQDWRQRQVQEAERQSETTKQDLLSRLADLQGQRAATVGGSFRGAAQPYLDQANALSGRIDQLARFRPTFDGKTPVFNAPNLDSYQLGQGPRIQAGGQPQQQTPALQALLGLGRREDEERMY